MRKPSTVIAQAVAELLEERTEGPVRTYRTHHFREVLRPKILADADYKCQIRLPGCTMKATVIDHILPRSAGGTNDPHNLRAACQACNQARRRIHPRPKRKQITPPESW